MRLPSRPLAVVRSKWTIVDAMAMLLKRVAYALASDDDAAQLMAGQHHAPTPWFKAERFETSFATQRMLDDHHWPLEPLPDLGRVHHYFVRRDAPPAQL